MSWDRVLVLGEDRAHRDFLWRLCRELGWRVVAEHIAPRGDQDASDWVIQQFPKRLQELRGGYERLGLLVAVDGDNKGRSRRLDALAEACSAHAQPPRTDLDAVAVLVPTWSIDTWGLFFCRDLVIPEHEKAKSRAKSLFARPHRGFTAPGVPVADAPRVLKPRNLDLLVEGLLGLQSHAHLPSIDASRADLRRWTR